MDRVEILLPAAALVGVTALVWVRLYVERLGEMRARHIDPQSLASARQAAAQLEHTQAADNFRNLFEVPVLFYLLCLCLALTGPVTQFFVDSAWGFVMLRAAHSFVHVTYNKVLHRFALYAASTLLLFVMWARYALDLTAGR